VIILSHIYEQALLAKDFNPMSWISTSNETVFSPDFLRVHFLARKLRERKLDVKEDKEWTATWTAIIVENIHKDVRAVCTLSSSLDLLLTFLFISTD
jgi:hypothetical protein